MSVFSCWNTACAVQQLVNCKGKSEALTVSRCAVVYCVTCAIRAIWPRRDLARTCFFDSWLSVPLLGRCLATVAEVAFAYQIASILKYASKKARCLRACKALGCVVPVVAVAQIVCWKAVASKQNLWHCLEQSLWVVTMLLCGCCSLVSSLHLRGDAVHLRRLRTNLLYGFVTSLIFALFMSLVDIPMWFRRSREDSARGAVFHTWPDGLADMASCGEVSRSPAYWEAEYAWRIGYFVGAAWFSRFLAQESHALQLKLD